MREGERERKKRAISERMTDGNANAEYDKKYGKKEKNVKSYEIEGGQWKKECIE